MPLVKAMETDADGKFDFGSLDEGHYTLIVDDEVWGSSEWFDVEIKNLPQRTASVTIDISPVTPDCKGGHEFVVSPR